MAVALGHNPKKLLRPAALKLYGEKMGNRRYITAVEVASAYGLGKKKAEVALAHHNLASAGFGHNAKSSYVSFTRAMHQGWLDSFDWLADIAEEFGKEIERKFGYDVNAAALNRFKQLMERGAYYKAEGLFKAFKFPEAEGKDAALKAYGREMADCEYYLARIIARDWKLGEELEKAAIMKMDKSGRMMVAATDIFNAMKSQGDS